MRPLDYSADNILRGEINRANEVTRFPKIELRGREKLLVRLVHLLIVHLLVHLLL